MKTAVVAAIALVAGASVGNAYEAYNIRSPNGNYDSGHMNGGYTNYANDQAANLDWKDLCPLDSDSDGLSNGKEMGDPCCVWTSGATPAYTSGMSNPGDPADAATNTVPDCPGGNPTPSPTPITPIATPTPISAGVIPYYTATGLQNPAIVNSGYTCGSQGFTAAMCINNARLAWSDLTMLACRKTDCVNNECCTNAPMPSCSSLPKGSCAIGYSIPLGSKRCTTDPCVVQECCERVAAKTDPCNEFNCYNCLDKGVACSWCKTADQSSQGCYSNLSMCEQSNQVPIRMTNPASCASIDSSNAGNSGLGSSSASSIATSVASVLLPALALFFF